MFTFTDIEKFEDDFIEWYDTGKPEADVETHLGESTISQIIIWEEIGEKCDYIKGEDRRWSRWDEYIVKIKNRYFSVGFDCGLTEMQDNEYDDSEIHEVEKHEKVKVIVEWVKK